MTFDDEEHHVKRILDTEPKPEQSDLRENQDSQDTPINQESFADTTQESANDTIDDAIQNKNENHNHKQDENKIDEEISNNTPHNKANNYHQDNKSNNYHQDNEANNDIKDNNKEVPLYDGDISTNIDKDFNANSEEVFTSPANAFKEEKQAREEKESEKPMGILDHLGELRRRLTRIVIFILLGFFVFYGVSEIAYSYLSSPLTSQLPEGSKLIYTSPQGAFFTYLKVAFMLSILGTSPFTFYQIWAFIAPGLYREEQRALMPLAFCSAVFFISGAAFCYFMVFPIAFKFFLSFTSDTVIPMISVEEYLSFALKLVIAFGLVFEMPLFAYFLAKLRLITPEGMKRHRKYAILTIFVIAAILTPPDVFSQTLMALPMIILYEVSIYVAKVARGLTTKKENKDAENAENPENTQNTETPDGTTNASGTKANPHASSDTKAQTDKTDLSKLSDEELTARINTFR